MNAYFSIAIHTGVLYSLINFVIPPADCVVSAGKVLERTTTNANRGWPLNTIQLAHAHITV